MNTGLRAFAPREFSNIGTEAFSDLLDPFPSLQTFVLREI
jgi:hypothetical protein